MLDSLVQILAVQEREMTYAQVAEVKEYQEFSPVDTNARADRIATVYFRYTTKSF
jgi:hypothetical protein